MAQTEPKKENATDVEDLIKTTTRKYVEKQVEEEVKRKKRPNREPGPKDFLIVPTDRGLYKIQLDGGGRLPKEFNQMYTRQAVAQRDIDKYLAKRGK